MLGNENLSKSPNSLKKQNFNSLWKIDRFLRQHPMVSSQDQLIYCHNNRLKPHAKIQTSLMEMLKLVAFITIIRCLGQRYMKLECFKKYKR